MKAATIMAMKPTLDAGSASMPSSKQALVTMLLTSSAVTMSSIGRTKLYFLKGEPPRLFNNHYIGSAAHSHAKDLIFLKYGTFAHGRFFTPLRRN